MTKLPILLLQTLLMVCACSDNPATPESPQWTREDLIGSWTGQLASITVVPDTTIPFWDFYRDNQLYNERHYFTNLDVNVIVAESSFLILLSFHSDSLVFMYSERGRWELSSQSPVLLRMDSTSVLGRLETWDNGVSWETSECCWRADLELESGDFSNSGFNSGVLRITNIQSGINISDLILEK